MSKNYALTWSPAVASSIPSVRQALQWAAGDDNPAVASRTMTVLEGSTILVIVDDEDFNGSPMGSGPPYAVTISDSRGGSSNTGEYTTPLYVADQYDLDSTEVFLRTNVAAGAITVTCNWTTNQWHGLTVAEIANVGATPTVTAYGLLNVAASTGTDAITSGTHNLGSSPALLVGFGRNATDIGTSDGYPTEGTGFSRIITGINWQGKESTSLNDTMTLESKYISNPGVVASTFTSRTQGPNPETFIAITVAFQ